MLALALVVVGLPVTLALLRSGRDPAVGSAPLSGSTLKEALKSSAFWRLEAAFFLISLVVGGLIVHLPAMLVDRGFSAAVAASTVSYLGYAIIVGRLSLGTLVDRFSPAIVGALLIALSALSSVLLAQGIAPLAATLLLGLCAGAEVDLLAFLVSRLFGLRNYAQIYGCGISAFTAGAGVGPILAGRAHDLSGGYAPALYGFAVAIVVACILIASLGGRVMASRAVPLATPAA
jgi:cyanate permease